MLMRLRDRKGFTLIEIIVVIVIIAILAAMLVPSLLKWVSKSKERTVLSEADTVKKSVIALVIEMSKEKDLDVNGTQTAACYDREFWKELGAMTDSSVQGSDSSKDKYVTFRVENDKVLDFSYTSGKITASYEDGEWSTTVR